MELNEYIEKGGQKLRLGYTTGSCAAAAAKAAATMILTGQEISQVRLRTPKGLDLILDIEDIRFYEDAVSCAVQKDSGDDPDITNHALIYAKVARSAMPGIRIDGGAGVGRVTKPGLDQPVGNAAINSTPRRMIEEAVREACLLYGTSVGFGSAVGTDNEVGTDTSLGTGTLPVTQGECIPGFIPGFDVTISVPRGRELAAKTFNPKLGIVGGISILGTSGIVEPMSDQALLDTIRVEINVRKQEGLSILPAAPGNYGKNFFLEKYGFSLDTAVTSSNFIYDTVRMAAEAGFAHMLFVGHIGKLVKVAGGIRNTHSQYGDHRMEILTDIAESILRQRNEENPDLRARLADSVMTDDAIRILGEYGLDKAVMAEMTRRIKTVMQSWTQGKMQVEAVVFSNVYGELGRTDRALEYMRILKAESEKNTRSL